MTLDFTTPEPAPRVHTIVRLDGEELVAVEPKGGQLMALQMAELTGVPEAKIINDFLDLCMEPASAARIKARLIDSDDPFDMDTLGRIIAGLQEAWTNRPPTKPAASSKQRRSTGRTSTANTRRVASTPDDSPRLASAT